MLACRAPPNITMACKAGKAHIDRVQECPIVTQLRKTTGSRAPLHQHSSTGRFHYFMSWLAPFVPSTHTSHTLTPHRAATRHGHSSHFNSTLPLTPYTQHTLPPDNSASRAITSQATSALSTRLSFACLSFFMQRFASTLIARPVVSTLSRSTFYRAMSVSADQIKEHSVVYDSQGKVAPSQHHSNSLHTASQPHIHSPPAHVASTGCQLTSTFSRFALSLHYNGLVCRNSQRLSKNTTHSLTHSCATVRVILVHFAHSSLLLSSPLLSSLLFSPATCRALTVSS